MQKEKRARLVHQLHGCTSKYKQCMNLQNSLPFLIWKPERQEMKRNWREKRNKDGIDGCLTERTTSITMEK